MRHYTAPAPLSGLSEIADRYDVILSDVWGVVHDGCAHTPCAADALTRFRARGGRVVLITNAPRPKPPILKMLDRFGLPRTAYDALVSSGDITAGLIGGRGAKPLRHIGPPRDLTLFDQVEAESGARPTLVSSLDEAAYVVCTGLFEDDDTPQTYLPLLEAMKARDLEMICANPDRVVHVGDDLKWCAGALAELYQERGGRVVMAGKPYPLIYARALGEAERICGAKIDPARVLCVGDGMFTDVRGAAALGVDALFVTAGVHRDALHPGGNPVIDANAYRKLLDEAGAAPVAHLRELTW